MLFDVSAITNNNKINININKVCTDIGIVLFRHERLSGAQLGLSGCGQWVAADCAVLPTANAGQYATSHCKPLLFWFPVTGGI